MTQRSCHSSQDLFSDGFSQLDVEESNQSQSKNDNTENDLISDINTDWLSLGSSMSSMPSQNKKSPKQKATTQFSQEWSQNFPESGHTLSTLSSVETQREMPKFSFLTTKNENSSFAAALPGRSPAHNAVKTFNKRLGSRFMYPKQKTASSISSLDSPLHMDISAMKANVLTQSQRKHSVHNNTTRSTDLESSRLGINIEVLEKVGSSLDDETVITTDIDSVTSDGTAYQASGRVAKTSTVRQSDVPHDEVMSLSSSPISFKQVPLPTVTPSESVSHSSVVQPSFTCTADSLAMSPSFQALAEELDNEQAITTETELDKIGQELDALSDDDMEGLLGDNLTTNNKNPEDKQSNTQAVDNKDKSQVGTTPRREKQVASLEDSIDLTASDEDEMAGVIKRCSGDVDVDLTVNDGEVDLVSQTSVSDRSQFMSNNSSGVILNSVKKTRHKRQLIESDDENSDDHKTQPGLKVIKTPEISLNTKDDQHVSQDTNSSDGNGIPGDGNDIPGDDNDIPGDKTSTSLKSNKKTKSNQLTKGHSSIKKGRRKGTNSAVLKIHEEKSSHTSADRYPATTHTEQSELDSSNLLMTPQTGNISSSSFSTLDSSNPSTSSRRRSTRISNINSKKAAASSISPLVNNSKVEKTPKSSIPANTSNNTPSKRHELANLVKVTLSPLKDLPLNVSSFISADSPTKHKMLDKSNVSTLPDIISQENASDQVMSLLEFLEETTIVIDKTVKTPGKTTPNNNKTTSSPSNNKPTRNLRKKNKTSTTTRESSSLSSASQCIADDSESDSNKQISHKTDTCVNEQLIPSSKDSCNSTKAASTDIVSRSSNVKETNNSNKSSQWRSLRKTKVTPKRLCKESSLETKSSEQQPENTLHLIHSLDTDICDKPKRTTQERIYRETTDKVPKTRNRSKRKSADYVSPVKPKEKRPSLPVDVVVGLFDCKSRKNHMVEPCNTENNNNSTVDSVQTPIDDSFEEPRTFKMLKDTPLWLAKYTVSKAKKSKNTENDIQTKTRMTNAEAVISLFGKSYGGVTRSKSQSGANTNKRDDNSNTSETKDKTKLSVYDFIPSQSSPVKSKKAKPSSKKISEPSKKPKATSKVKKTSGSKLSKKKKAAILKQINQQWGIDDNHNTHPQANGETEVLSQATTFRNHIDDIESNVSLIIEDNNTKKKRCTFKTDNLTEREDRKNTNEIKGDISELCSSTEICNGQIKTEIGPDQESFSTINVVKTINSTDNESKTKCNNLAKKETKKIEGDMMSPSPLIGHKKRIFNAVMSSESELELSANSDKATNSVKFASTKEQNGDKFRCKISESHSKTRNSGDKFESKTKSHIPNSKKSKKDDMTSTASRSVQHTRSGKIVSEKVDGIKPGKVNMAKSSVLSDSKKVISTAAAGSVIQTTGRATRNTQVGPKLLFTYTSLDKDQRRSVENCAKILDAEVTHQYSSEVSHVITSVDSDSHCPRTMKYMLAVLESKWVINSMWADICLEYGHHVSEEAFEVSGSTVAPNSLASFRSRMDCRNQKPPLLTGCCFYLSGEFSSPSPPKDELIQLIKAGNAKVLSRIPKEPCQGMVWHAPASSALSKSNTIIVSMSTPSTKNSNFIYVTPTWLMNCIAQYKLSDP